jgi:ABC-type branched-subunit amino acid transport system ATPase component
VPLLELRAVSKAFGGVRAVHRVSLAVEENQITFIVGPNGAGKTTLFNLITGVHHADEGSVWFEGQDITRISPDRAARIGIGRTFQIVKPLGRLTVLENVMLGAFLRTASPAEAAREAHGVLTYLEMDRASHLTANGLPLSMLKRLEIARAVATRPKLILLDEVVSGLSTTEALALAQLLKKLPERGIAAVAGVEHVMKVVMNSAERVVVLDHGTEIAQGAPQEVVRMPAVVEAYLGVKYREHVR